MSQVSLNPVTPAPPSGENGTLLKSHFQKEVTGTLTLLKDKK